MPLLIVTTGGTFDKEYGRGAGVRSLSFGKETAVLDVFDRVVVPADWTVFPLLSKDSLDMDDDDRAAILKHCAAAPERAIVITHGTDTMVATAGFIAAAKLATWTVTGPNLGAVADRLRQIDGVEQVVAFGTTLHVSSRDRDKLGAAIASVRDASHQWTEVSPGLEDVFISLMETAEDNFR